MILFILNETNFKETRGKPFEWAIFHVYSVNQYAYLSDYTFTLTSLSPQVSHENRYFAMSKSSPLINGYVRGGYYRSELHTSLGVGCRKVRETCSMEKAWRSSWLYQQIRKWHWAFLHVFLPPRRAIMPPTLSITCCLMQTWGFSSKNVFILSEVHSLRYVRLRRCSNRLSWIEIPTLNLFFRP